MSQWPRGQIRHNESWHKYQRLMDTARKRKRPPTKYVERHHVLPVAFGGRQTETVCLTYSEHFKAHELLVKFCTGKAKSKMLAALSHMASHDNRTIVTARQYAIARVAARALRILDWKDPIIRQRRIHERRLLWQKRYPGYTSIYTLSQKFDLSEQKIKGLAKSIGLDSEANRWSGIQLIELQRECIKWHGHNHNKNGSWITNGKISRKLTKGKALPKGWKFGVAPKSKMGPRNKIWITNGKINLYVEKNEPLPKGWKFGMKPKSNLGKRLISNGKTSRCLKKDSPLPKGWTYGALQWCWITNGKTDQRILKNEPLPKNWHYGRGLKFNINRTRKSDGRFI